MMRQGPITLFKIISTQGNYNFGGNHLSIGVAERLPGSVTAARPIY